MALWVHASSRWNRVTLGLASASLCWITSALPCDSSDAIVFPVSRCMFPILLWLMARSLWNNETLGFASG